MVRTHTFPGIPRLGAHSVKAFFPLMLFGILWADLIVQLSQVWRSNPQYSYGIFVPLLAAALFWQRWTLKPSPTPSLAWWTPWLNVSVAFVALALLPLRIIYEINPDWPLISWILTTGVVGLSLYTVFLIGGLPWARHFAFPICFILVAVRWPYRIEHALIQGLMKSVANLSSEILGWFDIPCVAHGNVIKTSAGMIGLSEACSGIRSFQATLMGGLFLGELYRLNWLRRFFLVVGGLVLAFGFNVVRTSAVVARASSEGSDDIEKWHDRAGIIIFLASFICLWALAGWINRRKSHRAGNTAASASQPVAAQPEWACPRLGIALGCWGVVLVAGNQLWYGIHQSQPNHVANWSVAMPTQISSFQALNLSAKESAILSCDATSGGNWNEPDGSHWTAWFLRWDAKSMVSLVAARAHKPETCIPASGLKLQADHGLRWYPAGGLNLPFRTYTFDNAGASLNVFFCLWQDGTENLPHRESIDLAGRVWAALAGHRKLGQQSFEVIIQNSNSFQDAELSFCKRLPELIRMEPRVREITLQSSAE